MFNVVFNLCAVYVFLSGAVSVVTFIEGNRSDRNGENDFDCDFSILNYIFIPSILFVKMLEFLTDPGYLYDYEGKPWEEN